MTLNRREFARALGAAAAGTVALGRPASGDAWETGDAPGRTAPFQLSVMLWTVFRDLPFEQRLEKVAEAGYRAVQLVHEYDKWSEEDFRNANRKKRSFGMGFDTAAGLRKGICDPAERDAFLAEVRSKMPVLDKLECSRLIVLSGNKNPDLPLREQHQSCVEGLKRAAEIAAERNVELLLENIDPEENPKYYLTSVAEGFEIIGEVNHPRVKFLYDLFHEQIAEGNLIEKLEKNIGKVGLIHIADVPGRHEPGTGEINFPNIYRKLGHLRYNRFVAMEFLPTGDPIASLRAAREMAMQYGSG
ncbi:MAG: hypothetical protein AUG07_03025 [Acidobacteria bacterium 13_1_20CM_2_60_10]|nr:MAG: hypothetical protein AUG07_03025 [Acidobacteria bacterium 13_1_20CM_2_60_10]